MRYTVITSEGTEHLDDASPEDAQRLQVYRNLIEAYDEPITITAPEGEETERHD